MNCDAVLELALRLDRLGPESGVDAVVADWLALVESRLGALRPAVVLSRPDGRGLLAYRSDGRRTEWPPGGSAPGEDPVLRVMRTGDALVLDDTGNGQSVPELTGSTPSAALFPLADGDGAHGVFVAGWREAGGPGPETAFRLSQLAGRLGTAVGRARRFEALAADCRALERKCTLRMSALKKTVWKLESEIRERKKVASALRKKEDQFQAIADYTYDWESWLSEEGRLLWVNPAVERITGFGPGECLAMAEYPLDIVVDTDRAQVRALLDRALQERTTGNDVAFRIRHKDGGERWMAISWQPIYNDAMGFMGFRTSIRDISQRKAFEEDLKRSNERLEAEVARRTEKVRALQKRLQAENLFLRKELADTSAFGELIGESPSIQAVISRIELVAPTRASVLILGESGTGKELVAREIHKHSLLKHRAFIPVNCATIPEDLYESEFFGHVRGAFTGAVRDRIGRFEAADGGTIFLDEVGEIPLPLQGKLLRVLQEGEFERVGEARTRKVTVRVIAATNARLEEEVRQRRFREDLYYRLNVFPIEITPLRDRKEDIPLLAGHFLERYARRMNRPTPKLTRANLMDLQAHQWPGNVRELQNLIERALILSPGGRLRFDLPSGEAAALAAPERPDPQPAEEAPPVLTESEIKALQKRNVAAALAKSGGRIYGREGAAALLEVKPTTLIARMKAMGIRKPAPPG